MDNVVNPVAGTTPAYDAMLIKAERVIDDLTKEGCPFRVIVQALNVYAWNQAKNNTRANMLGNARVWGEVAGLIRTVILKCIEEKLE